MTKSKISLDYLYLVLITFFASFFMWLLFYFNIPGKIGFNSVSLETVFANYDGPNYMVITKCGYVKDCIGPHYSLPQPLEYYPAHFPGYPLMIKFFEYFTTGPKAMLLVTLLGSIFLTLIFYEFLKLFIKEKNAFWLSVLFIFFPARFFVLRLVGAPETWFLATTIASIFYFKKQKYFWSAVFAAVAMTLKTPAVLLGFSYLVLAVYELIKTKNLKLVFKKYFSFVLIPLVVLAIFYFYKSETGDFYAYFHSGDNFHLNSLPYLVFISGKSWINTIWLEDIIYIFLFGFYGVYRLFKKYKFSIIPVYSTIFFLATIFVAHRDISRYIAPIYPFLILAFNRFLSKKSVKIIFWVLLPAIILYAINFIVGNTAPISDWTNYL